jgi:aryl-alcohol dehydrogenase-like predicted oxidoreductase
MDDAWLHRTPTAFPNKRLFRLGLAANYGIDEDGVRAAMDRGVNLFVWTMRGSGLANPLKAALSERRDQVAVAGFASLGWFGWGVRKSAERLLRSLGTDYLDLFMLPWLGLGSALTSATERDLVHLRESGKARAIGTSIHDRVRAGELAEKGPLDLLMIRYNAAHPGAEKDIFPHVHAAKPTVLAYTATSWRKLLKKPSGWSGDAMTASDCYRFQLSSPHVDLALTGPASRRELDENLDGVMKGPLTSEEAAWMREFGRQVHG